MGKGTIAHERERDLSWKQFPFRGRYLLRLLVAAIALIGVGVAVGFVIVGPLNTSIGALDSDIASWFGAHRTPIWNDLTWLGSTSADIIVKVPAAIALTVLFLWKWRRWYEPALLDGALALESIVFVAIALIVDRARPVIEQLDSIPPTGSFPSGHTAAAVVFYGAIALIVWKNVENRLVGAFAAMAAAVMPVVVGASRLYRGMHFFSDVLIGFILGAISLWLVWQTLELHEMTDPQIRSRPSRSRRPK